MAEGIQLTPDPRLPQGLSFQRLFHAVFAWSRKQFGDQNSRGPKGPLRHMEMECREAIEAWDRLIAQGGLLNPLIPDALKAAFLEELADLQILLFDTLWRAGAGPVHLLQMAEMKMVKNVRRDWPAASAEQPIEHVRDEKTIAPGVTPPPIDAGEANTDFPKGV